MVKRMENHIKMDDLGVPLFLETPKVVFLFVFVPTGRHIAVIIGPPSNDLQRETARRMARDLPRSGSIKTSWWFQPI